MTSGRPLVSIIVPTYNERDNLPELVARLDAALRGVPYEIVIVDDNSPDGTAELALELSKKYPIRVIKRPGKLGLASAVLDGFRAARGDILVVMDADLQHPPEVVPQLVKKVQEGYDIAIASRYVPGGKTVGWSFIRKIISRGAILLAHIVLPRTRHIRDPVSGFFAVRKSVVENILDKIRPRGFKILLDILVHGTYKSVAEVPYTFEPRRAGKSKLSRREIVEYVKQLLYLTNFRIVKFAIVGASGVGVNMLVFYILTHLLGITPFISGIVAIECAVLNNFTWNDIWTFRDRRHGGVLSRLLKYHAAVALGVVVNYLTMAVLVLLGWAYLLAHFTGIIAGFITNYICGELFVWSRIGFMHE